MDAATRTEAAKLLMSAIFSEATSNETKAGMISMISFLKEAALVIEPELLSLRKKSKNLEETINQALVGMGSDQTGAILTGQLAVEPTPSLLRDLAAIGIAGTGAGPTATELLDHSDKEIRLAAARCLGYINYKESVPKLIKLLDEPSDFRLNWIAAESLGRIADKAALNALKRISKSHWYPAVRNAAVKAVKNINSSVVSSHYEINKDRFGYEFFCYKNLSAPVCKKIKLEKVKESAGTKLLIKHDEDKLQTLSYPSEIIGFDASDAEEQLAAGNVVEIRPDNMIEIRDPITQTPDVAMRTEHGWLVGSSRGEFGGELVYIADDKEAVMIFSDNIENIYRLGKRYIAIAGLCHMTLNDGMVYELKPAGDGKWDYKPWRTLPGAPSSSWLVETGEVLVNTAGGSILISDDGSMRMAPCR
ncbi:MAG: hypothetical protein D3916_14145 [Candidatus Electrothrix sp. MAN1_4]|nr:hypothetical protein [Candidatus Electrothrix sp. MAN1_4]